VKQPLGVTSRVPTVRGLDNSSHLLGSRTAKRGGRGRCANERKNNPRTGNAAYDFAVGEHVVIVN
jgi:hypothetical protein